MKSYHTVADGSKWTDVQLATVLNHVDWCFDNKKNFWSPEQQKNLERGTGRCLNQKRVAHALTKLCRKQNPPIDYHNLVENGTAVLKHDTLSGSLIKQMNLGREDLGLSAFGPGSEQTPYVVSESEDDIAKEDLAHTNQHIQSPREVHEEHQAPSEPSTSRRKHGPRVEPERERKRKAYVSPDNKSSDGGAESLDVTNKQLKKLEKAVEFQGQINASILMKLSRFQGKPCPEESSLMRSIYRTIWEEPLNAYDRFCEDLRQTDRILQKYQCLVSDLVGPRDYSREVEFPPVPANDDIAKSWLSSRSKVKQATRPAETPPSLVDLAATGEFSATYLASLANGKGNSVPADPRFWICTRRKELDNPVTARHLITVVLIQELFGGGEFYVGSYALGIYRTMQDKEQIRRRDRMAFQLFSQSPQYKEQVLLPRVKGILERVEACAKELPDLFFPDFMSDYSVEQALSLERTLLISRDDYRVYYPRPGVAFDPAWMKAEDHRGEVKDPLSCSETKVSICMYPALVQTPSRELAADADITEALTQTKSFLPPPGKAASPLPDDTVISKAYVMVD